MDAATLARATELMVGWICGRNPPDPRKLNACWQLNDLLGDQLAPQRMAVLHDQPEANRATWQAALAELATRDTVARDLVLTLGEDPNPPPPPPPPPTPERRVQLLLLDQGEQIHVRLLHGPQGGEPHAVVPRPFSERDLPVVLKALLTRSDPSLRFDPAEWQTLERLQLASDDWLHPRLLELVGERLYAVLFAGGVGEQLRAIIGAARPQRASIHVELLLDELSVALSRYPWELIKDQHLALLPARIVELTRYITLETPPPPSRNLSALRILYVAPRPRDLPALPPHADLRPIRQALPPNAELRIATQATREALLNSLNDNRWQPDVLHFDGHGSIFRLCPNLPCGSRNRPQRAFCGRCGTTLAHAPPRGRLAFEQSDGSTDWVDSQWLSNLLSGSSVELAVLLACLSGSAEGESIFNSVGPGLIKAGVPGVVAAQQAFSNGAAVRFAQGFYAAFAAGKDLPAAMTAGRRSLFDGEEWFVPTLYLRRSHGAPPG